MVASRSQQRQRVLKKSCCKWWGDDGPWPLSNFLVDGGIKVSGHHLVCGGGCWRGKGEVQLDDIIHRVFCWYCREGDADREYGVLEVRVKEVWLGQVGARRGIQCAN